MVLYLNNSFKQLTILYYTLFRKVSYIQIIIYKYRTFINDYYLKINYIKDKKVNVLK